MNPIKRLTYLVALTLALVTSVWLLLKHITHVKIEKATTANMHQFTNLTVQQYNPKGTLEYVIDTPSTYQQAADKSQQLDSPHIRVTKENQPKLTIDAKLALVTKEAKEVKLQHDVNIHHEAYKEQGAGDIKTESLSYFPQTKKALTNEKITWDQQDNHIEAVGLEAYVDTHEVELIKLIKGTYKTEKDGVIHFTAGHALLNEAKGTGVFTKGVTIDNETMHLRADKATALMDEKHQFTKATAWGTADKTAHAWIKLAPNKPLLHAYASTLIYHPRSEELELIGNAQIKQGESHLKAPHICYNLGTETLTTAQKHNKRTRILIDPGPNTKDMYERLSVTHHE